MVTLDGGSRRGPVIFVTVGSTRFFDLIDTVLSRSFVRALASASSENDVHLVVQYGSTPLADILSSSESALTHEEQGGGVHAISSRIATSIITTKKATGEREDEKEVEDSVVLERMAKVFRPDDTLQRDGDSNQFTSSGSLCFRVPSSETNNAVFIELLDYVSSITPYLRTADIVISHAGSGTILETLRLDKPNKPSLVVVPNETLMDNHQTELALALAKKNYVIATRVSKSNNRLPELISTLLSQDSATIPAVRPFPDAVPGRFRSFVDAEMGYF